MSGMANHEHWDKATHDPRAYNAHPSRSLTVAIILSRNKSSAQA